MAVKNTCSPQSIFGGFDQTLFLGCSVMSFSASAGWNEQVAEITVQLLQDPCAGTKVYWDSNLEQQTHTGADPGFIGEIRAIIGAPVYFRVGDFEFSGIVQTWEKVDLKDLNSGLPVKSNGENINAYSVRITDPRQLLENCQVIINEYAGNIDSLDNVVNVYGYLESLGDACPSYTQSPDGIIFGAESGGYGSAEVNNNGISWNKIIMGLRPLLSGTTPDAAFSSGFIAFKGDTNTGYSGMTPNNGMGLINSSGGEAHYIVDLEEVPGSGGAGVPSFPDDIRVNGLSVSLMTLISDVCQAAGMDYYIEFLPTIDSGTVYKFIKIRTVNRIVQPTFGAVEAFIEAHDVGSKENTVGRELRNEMTGQLVIGGQKQNIFDTSLIASPTDPEEDGEPSPEEADDMIIPYFGLDSSGNVIIPEVNADDEWEFEANTIPLNIQLAEYGYDLGVDSVTITEGELRAALSSYTTWTSYSMEKTTDISNAIDMKALFNPQLIEEIVDAAGDDALAARDFMRTGNGMNMLQNAEDRKLINALQTIFDFVHKYATEFYGKKFQVRIPFTCVRLDDTSGQILTSEVPSDGGWTELDTVLGLDNPSSALDFFRHEDNRIMAILRFSNAVEADISKMDIEDYVGDAVTETLWVKAEAEPDFVYLDRATMTFPRAVLTISQAIPRITDGGDNVPRIKFLKETYDAIEDEIETSLGGVGGSSIYLPYESRAFMPDAAAVPIRSNVLRYGPWGSATVAGATNVRDDDEGLVPWEFGGMDNLNTAGNILALEGLTSLQTVEQGSITVPGYPTIPLHAELLSATAANSFSGAGPFVGGGTNRIEGRSITTGSGYDFVDMGVLWEGTYGPNITSVTTKVDTTGIETTYTIRTYTSKFGRFAKLNAERLKKAGQFAMKQAKFVRAFARQRSKLDFLRKNGGADTRLSRRQDIHTNYGEHHSPHEVFVGSQNNWNSENVPTGTWRRPIIETTSIKGLETEFTDYHKKAFMSLDGLLLPVSMDGGNTEKDFPMYVRTPAQISSSILKPTNNSIRPQGPLAKSGTPNTLDQYNLEIDVDYLNPFSNPGGMARSSVVEDYSDTTGIGHHIEIVGRVGESGNVPPASSMVMPIQGLVDNDGDLSKSDYQPDYRMMALRGPLLLQSWGYDTDGKPVPNAADGVNRSTTGNFGGSDADYDGMTNKFLGDWLRRPQTWPVAPVDLRLDRRRGVWVAPQPYKTMYGKLEATLVPDGSALIVPLNVSNLADEDGNSFNPVFYGHGMLRNEVGLSGEYVDAEFDSENNRYNVVRIHHRTTVIGACQDSGGLNGPGAALFDVVLTNGSLAPDTTFGPVTGYNWLPDVVVGSGANSVVLSKDVKSGWFIIVAEACTGNV